MKGIIIYASKYGATEQYAKWYSDQLNLPIISSGEINGTALKQYDYFILGSSVYIGKLRIGKWTEKNAAFLRGKKIFLFQVAGAPANQVEKREAFNAQSISPAILGNCQPFYLHGRLILSKLSWFDRFMLKMGSKMAKYEEDKQAMTTEYDDVKKEYIIPLVRAVKEYRTAIAV
jgi:menaquinone-dependent protoporphyrinogen IX oxidase